MPTMLRHSKSQTTLDLHTQGDNDNKIAAQEKYLGLVSRRKGTNPMKCKSCGKKLESKKLIKKSERFCDDKCREKFIKKPIKLTLDQLNDLIFEEPRQS